MRTTILFFILCSLPLSLCGAEGIELSADSFILSFAADGRPNTCRRKSDGAELLRAGNGGQGFYLKAPDAALVRLTKLFLRPDGRFSARSEDDSKAVHFRVTRGQRHLAFRIEGVEGVAPERLNALHFELNADPGLRVLDLDYMTRVDNRPDGVRVEWRDLWRRSPQNPLGGFAIYEKTTDDDEDAMLLRLWVEEQLPHPKVQGAWTVERARLWVGEWQRRFSDRSQLILAGRSIAELHEGVRFARRAISSGHFLQYAGGDKAIVYDENWRRRTELPVEKANYMMPTGQASITVSADRSGPLPWMEAQFLTTGVSIPVGK